MDEYYEEKSAWDSREEYCKLLHELDVQANLIKVEIELSRGNKVENLRKYFSALKFFYRALKPNIKKKEEWNGEVQKIRRLISYMIIRNKKGGTYKRRLIIPPNLEDRMESFHDFLNQTRYDKDLLIPKKDEPEHDPSKVYYKGKFG